MTYKFLLIPFFALQYFHHANGQDAASKPVIHKPTEIIITKESTPLTGTPETEFKGEFMCVTSTTIVTLGTTTSIKLKYIDTIETKEIRESIKVYDSTSKLKIAPETANLNSVVFTLDNVYKILLFASKVDDKCFDKYLISQNEKNDQFVHLTHMKCIHTEEVKAYYDKAIKDTTTTKPFVVGGKNICFIASMLAGPICIEASDKTKSYTIIISPYSKPAQKCTTPSKSCISPTNTTTIVNGTETAKQSATPIIISVVVIIVVIIGGGIGYFMMKK